VPPLQLPSFGDVLHSCVGVPLHPSARAVGRRRHLPHVSCHDARGWGQERQRSGRGRASTLSTTRRSPRGVGVLLAGARRAAARRSPCTPTLPAPAVTRGHAAIRARHPSARGTARLGVEGARGSFDAALSGAPSADALRVLDNGRPVPHSSGECSSAGAGCAPPPIHTQRPRPRPRQLRGPRVCGAPHRRCVRPRRAPPLRRCQAQPWLVRLGMPTAATRSTRSRTYTAGGGLVSTDSGTPLVGPLPRAALGATG